SEIALQATTDAEGKFDLHHLPSDHRVVFGCRHATIVWQSVLLDTGNHTDIDEITFQGGRQNKSKLRRSPIDITAEIQPSLAIKVTNSQGQPVEGGAITAITEKRYSAGEAQVNAQGHADLALRETGKLSLRYAANPLAPVLSAGVPVEVLPNQ